MRKKIPKIEKPKDVGHLPVQKSQNFDFCACPSQNVAKRNASGKNAKLKPCETSSSYRVLLSDETKTWERKVIFNFEIWLLRHMKTESTVQTKKISSDREKCL